MSKTGGAVSMWLRLRLRSGAQFAMASFGRNELGKASENGGANSMLLLLLPCSRAASESTSGPNWQVATFSVGRDEFGSVSESGNDASIGLLLLLLSVSSVSAGSPASGKRVSRGLADSGGCLVGDSGPSEGLPKAEGWSAGVVRM